MNLLTTNATGPYVDYPSSNAMFRFYRVRSPGTTVAEALNEWNSKKPVRYRFRFLTTKWEQGGATLEATVTVSAGVKTVSEVTVNEISTVEFIPSDFPTLEEIFGRLADVEAHGIKLAHVAYDAEWSFPNSVSIIGETDTAPVFFKVSDFVPEPAVR